MNDIIKSFFQFVGNQSGKLFEQTLVHSGLTFLSLFIAVVVSLPLGIWISRRQRSAKTILGIAGILQTIPSIALLGFMIPVLGIGPKPAIVALFLYALLPIIRNTYTGILGVDGSVREAAAAMGMTRQQILWRVELPLAFPVILAGIRTATVITVGVATLAAYIGAGGLGEFIFGGIALNNSVMIMAGAIPSALLALLFDFLLSKLQKLNLRKLKPVLVTGVVMFVAISSLYFVPSVFGSRLTAGFPPEFMGRSDGYPGLQKAYGLKINTVVIGPALVYKAIREKEVDIISGYSTDGRLKAYHLGILADDRHIFPPYYAAPLVSEEVLTKYPQLEDVINLLAGKINDSVMTELNYQVDILNQSPEATAKNFLKKVGLYKPPENRTGGTIRIGSKIFSEQYTLAQMYKMLIEGNTGLTVQTSTGLGGTKICFDALVNHQIDLYPEYTGTGLEVILQTPEDIARRLEGNKDSVFNYVTREFQTRYRLKWLRPIGFNNTYAILMRDDEMQSLKINTISDLVTYLAQ